MYRGSYIKIEDFSGGYAGNLPASTLKTNQAADLDNVVIGPGGRYIRTRYPSKKENDTEVGTVSDGYPTVGVGLLTVGNATSIGIVKKGKFYGANALASGMTFTDRTGVVTITNQSTVLSEQQFTRWSFCNHNSLMIGFGGSVRSPDAPFKWAGETNNIAALGGSPPSAAFGFSANNRVFGCRTSSNPSILQWSVLGNPEDWTGTGSGSTTVGSLNDSTPIMGYALLPQNILLIFKETSTYQISLVSAPFPQYLLFGGTGAILDSVVTVDDTVYFISNKYQPMMTDGDRLVPLPNSADNLFQDISHAYQGILAYYSVHGYRFRGFDCDLVCWSFVSPSSGSFYTVAWDLINKCWLKFSTGMNFTSTASTTFSSASGGFAVDQSVFYGGYYNQGIVFQPDLITTAGGSDDTGENSGKINSYWRTGWLTEGPSEQITQVNKIVIGHDVNSTNSTALTLNYGFGFVSDQKSTTISRTPSSTETETMHTIQPVGNGNGFQLKIGQNTTANSFKINRIWIGGKASGQRQLVA